MNSVVTGACVAGMTLLCGSAQAAIVFSNYSSVGAAGPAVPTFGPFDADLSFDFPAGMVGDPVDPLRVSSVQITFDGTSNSGAIDGMVLSALGSALGSGFVTIDVMVHDMMTPGMIAVGNLTYDVNNPPPVFTNLNFSRATESFQVIATVSLSALDTQAFDMAQVSLIEMLFTPVPAPASGVAIAALGLLTSRRRR